MSINRQQIKQKINDHTSMIRTCGIQIEEASDSISKLNHLYHPGLIKTIITHRDLYRGHMITATNRLYDARERFKRISHPFNQKC